MTNYVVPPKKKVSNLSAPKRTGSKVTCTWTVPAACKKANAPDSVRFDGLDWIWAFDAVPETKGLKKGKGDTVTPDLTNKNTQKSDTETFKRANWYPLAGKPKMSSITFAIRGYRNVPPPSTITRADGVFSYSTLKLLPPDPPTCSVSYDSATGRATASYTAAHPDGAKECYDTVASVWVGGTKVVDAKAYTNPTKSFGPYEVPNAGVLGIGKWCKVAISALNRGLAGNSKTNGTAVYYVCHPNPPVCGEPALVYATPGTLSTAAVRVPITNEGWVKDGNTVIRPATVTLQRLKDSTAETPEAAASVATGWQDVVSNNGVTNGLSDTWTNGVSDSGKHTWYRAVAIRDGYSTYGMPVMAKCIDVKSNSSTSGHGYISAHAPGDDGTSVKVTLAGKSANDEGYEVSWADAADAWDSTQPPATFLTTASSLIVKGLEENVQYYFRARTYDINAQGDTVYGTYSDIVNETPISTPTTVVLDGPGTTPRGSAIMLSWTYDTDSPQSEWKLVDSSGVCYENGSGVSCAFAISPDRYGSASSLTLRIEMTTGSGWAHSDYRTFAIADPPSCTLVAGGTVTAQPVAFDVQSDTGDSVVVSLTALGSSGTGLYGDIEQYAGDTVHSASYEPDWAVADNVRGAHIGLPDGLALFEGAGYLLSVHRVDASTGLSSAVRTAEMYVAWSHTAQQPTATVIVNAADRTASVTVAAPADYAAGDRFDLYRVTADGERRIAAAQPFGTKVVDRLAPYSIDGTGLHYLAVTRTADGDSCVSDDIGYTLKAAPLRFDWGSKYIELPYDIGITDTVAKDSETRKHLDGTTQAYWNDGVTRKAVLATNLIRFEDAEQQELLRDMLQHPGSVFVRTPDGNAYAADVQPGTVQRAADSSTVGVTLNATEHDLTDECRPSENDIMQPSWGGGEVEESGGVVYDTAGGFPMDDWVFIGYAGTTLYVCDPDGTVRDGDGDEMADWEWDGTVLYDDNGDPVEVTDEPEE